MGYRGTALGPEGQNRSLDLASIPIKKRKVLLRRKSRRKSVRFPIVFSISFPYSVLIICNQKGAKTPDDLYGKHGISGLHQQVVIDLLMIAMSEMGDMKSWS
jgi:hypothetical protein